MRALLLLSLGTVLAALPAAAPQDPPATGQPVEANLYIGAGTCKGCHNGEKKGDAHGIWTQSRHASAFATLATEKAKAIAKERGIEDPQQSDKCLRCHVTAFGTKDEERKAKFTFADGVQCESCHGPGDRHRQLRIKPTKPPTPIGADEIRSGRDPKQCAACHNAESPTFQPFCLVERMAKIEHLDPRKERGEEALAKLRATCAPGCKPCAERQAKKGGKEGEAEGGGGKEGGRKEGGGKEGPGR